MRAQPPRASLLLIAILAMQLVDASPGAAAPPPAGRSEAAPSVMAYGWRGMGIGALIGTSVGYLSYRSDDDEKAILRGAAYGAIGGAFLGIAIGLGDAQDGRKSVGAVILRDMQRGAILGLVAGAIYGSVQGVTDGEWEKLGEGAAWGYLAGSILGLGIGVYEGRESGADFADATSFRLSLEPVAHRPRLAHASEMGLALRLSWP